MIVIGILATIALVLAWHVIQKLERSPFDINLVWELDTIRTGEDSLKVWGGSTGGIRKALEPDEDVIYFVSPPRYPWEDKHTVELIVTNVAVPKDAFGEDDER